MARREMTSQEKRFMRLIWVLPLCMALGGAATLATGDDVWISSGCAVGVAVWIAIGLAQHSAAETRAGVARQDRAEP